MVVLLGLVHAAAYAVDDWLFDDFGERETVNQGKLEFLKTPPSKPVHHHINQIRLHDSSLKDGWVSLTQCHHNLDPVSRLEIVFRPGYVKGLRIKQVENIGKARIKGVSVQLEDVEKKARICLQAWTLSLKKMGDSRFRLRNGPYMRKFLDGYYPMRVTVEVFLPATLEFESMVPSKQRGFDVIDNASRVRFDTWFEGQLLTEMIFRVKFRQPR